MYNIQIYETIINKTINSIEIIFDFDILTDKKYFIFSEELFKFVYLDNKMFDYYKNIILNTLKNSEKEIKELISEIKQTIPDIRIKKIIKNKNFKIIISLGRCDLDIIEKQIDSFSFSKF